MKIAIPTNIYLPSYSGVALFIRDTAEQMAKKNKITVHTIQRGKQRKSETIKKVKILRYPGKEIARSYTISKDMLEALKKSDADIIHSHHYGYYPAYAGLKAAKHKKIPHIFSTHFHPPIFGFKRALLFHAYHKTQGKKILKNSDAILPHTNFEANWLKKYGAPKNKIHIIPSTVNTKIFKPKRVSIPKNINNQIVLFAASLDTPKGADIAFNIAKKILKDRKDTTFIFIGQGRLEKQFKQQAKKYDKKSFLFLKNLPEKELSNWYSRASIFLLPSHYEAFGRAMAEAIACETPVVATNVGGIPEVSGPASLLCDYGNWDEMHVNLEILLNNSKKAKKMGRDGKKHVKKNFDTSVVVKQLEKVYKQVKK